MESSPVRNAAGHVAEMNKVKLIIREGPVLVDVVNLEFAVGRYEGWLDGRNINPDDLG